MLFYFEITVLWAICGAATYAVATYYPSFSLWLMFLYAAAVILYARLLGRLAWRLAEAMPIIEEYPV
jgi:hypothetical protein